MTISKQNKKRAIVGGGLLLLIASVIWYQKQQQPTLVDMRGKLPTDPYKQLPTRTLDKIEFIVVHHTAGNPQSLEYYASLHVSKGFRAIAYHELIDENGTVYICHNPTTISFHNENNNTKSYGVCLIGNFEGQEPSKEQLRALEQRIRYNRKRFPNTVDVKGHGEFKATACPGHHLQKHLEPFKLQA